MGWETAHRSSSPQEYSLSKLSRLLVPPVPVEIAAGVGSSQQMKTQGLLRFREESERCGADCLGGTASIIVVGRDTNRPFHGPV